MKIKEVHNSKLAKILNVGGITLYPFIFYYGVPDESTRVHEFQHALQVRQHGILKFYVSYVWYYLKGRMRGLDHYSAYMAIPYETEAYHVQEVFDKAKTELKKVYLENKIGELIG
jgi:hypothetical protein